MKIMETKLRVHFIDARRSVQIIFYEIHIVRTPE